ncbi:histidine phosphatase family protein [Candidatus Uhrbacteria bacterium]|nr:histidine phosphatase family protein [Candidatus Uhrbacteria bacterium]
MQKSAIIPALAPKTLGLIGQVMNYSDDRCVLVVRHCNTTKANPGEDDNVRVPTEKGLEQCRQAREVYAQHRPKLVICTGAQRTVATAQETFSPPIIAVPAPGMYPFNEEGVDTIFKAEGNVPLSRYFDGGWDPNGWLQRSLTGSLEVLREHGDLRIDENLTFVNHGAFGPTLAWAFAEYLEVDASIALNIQLDEVEGLLVTLKGIQHLTLPC